MLPRMTVIDVGGLVILPEKVVISKKKVITFLAITCNTTRDQHELIHVAVVPQICLALLLCQQTKKFGKHCSST